MCLFYACAALRSFVFSFGCQHLIVLFVKIMISGLFSNTMGVLAAGPSSCWQPWVPCVVAAPSRPWAPVFPARPFVGVTGSTIQVRDQDNCGSKATGGADRLHRSAAEEQNGLCPLTTPVELLETFRGSFYCSKNSNDILCSVQTTQQSFSHRIPCNGCGPGPLRTVWT